MEVGLLHPNGGSMEKFKKLLFNLSKLSPLTARIKLVWGQFRGVETFKGAGEAVISIDEPFLLTLILL